MGVGAWGSWFGRIGFHGIIDGVLTLSTPTSIAADRLKRDYVKASCGRRRWRTCVERVIVTVRKR